MMTAPIRKQPVSHTLNLTLTYDDNCTRPFRVSQLMVVGPSAVRPFSDLHSRTALEAH